MRSFTALVLLLASTSHAFADDAAESGIAVLARAGTLGLGVEIGRSISDRWALRLGANTFSYDRDIVESDVTYDASLDLRSAGLTLDWHPFAGSFRFSLGAFHNGNEFNVVGRPTGGSFDINGTTYTASQIGSLTGKIDFKGFAPLVALGWGNGAARGFAYSIDIGALYQRDPRAALSVTCGSGVSCSQLQADVAAEQRELQGDLDGFKWWPVIQVGIGWVF